MILLCTANFQTQYDETRIPLLKKVCGLIMTVSDCDDQDFGKLAACFMSFKIHFIF